MKSIEELYIAAMGDAQKAREMEKNGDPGAKSYYIRALCSAQEAAFRADEGEECSISRGVLYLSAFVLAQLAGETIIARALGESALDGELSACTREELEKFLFEGGENPLTPHLIMDTKDASLISNLSIVANNGKEGISMT